MAIAADLHQPSEAGSPRAKDSYRRAVHRLVFAVFVIALSIVLLSIVFDWWTPGARWLFSWLVAMCVSASVGAYGIHSVRSERKQRSAHNAGQPAARNSR